MKLCFITYQFKTGGVERVFCALAKELNAYDVYLLSVTPGRDEMVNNIPSNVEVIDIHQSSYFRFLDKIRNKCPIISNLVSTLYILSLVLYVRLSKKFNNTTFINFADTISSMILAYMGSHNKKVYSWLHYNPRTFYSSKFKLLYQFIYKKFYKIVCICNEQLELLVETVPGINRERLTVIYNILDYDQMSRLGAEKLEFNNSYIVMVARFDLRSKDFVTLINAYSRLPYNLRYNYKLVFVGDGPDMRAVKDFTSLSGDSENIVFVGMQNNPYKWIRNSTILVHSSKTEGLPTVLLEAMACEVPIISTNCKTGPKEILDYGKAGVLVDVGDEEAMYNSIKELLESKDKRFEYIQNGNSQLKKFSKQLILNKVNNLWNK